VWWHIYGTEILLDILHIVPKVCLQCNIYLNVFKFVKMWDHIWSQCQSRFSLKYYWGWSKWIKDFPRLWLRAHMHTCAHAHTHAHTRTHARTHTHTHTHIYMKNFCFGQNITANMSRSCFYYCTVYSTCQIINIKPGSRMIWNLKQQHVKILSS
jgi:hypothetical protein